MLSETRDEAVNEGGWMVTKITRELEGERVVAEAYTRPPLGST